MSSLTHRATSDLLPPTLRWREREGLAVHVVASWPVGRRIAASQLSRQFYVGRRCVSIWLNF